MAAPFHTGTELAEVLTPGSQSEASSSPVSVEHAQLHNQVTEFDINGQEQSFGHVFIDNTIQAVEMPKTRPLNSWITYRTFYSRMFHNFQQKQVSTLLQVLWAEDPFKAKWAILAKAYSMIKDRVGKKDAPLDHFLDLCCPEIGIISINEYLSKLNWDVGTNTKGELTLTQTEAPDFANFEAELTNCFMNEIDVIEFCVREGFFPDFDPFAEDVTNNPNRLMGVATVKPGQAKQSFLAAISANPKAIAAQILGWDVDHEFFKISTDPTIPAVGAAINMADHPGLVDHLDIMGAEYPQVPEMTQPEDHVWTGNMSELYKPTEISIEFDSVTAPEKWNSTDIGNPTALDGSLQAAGYDPNILNPNVPADNAGNLAYTFGDSF